MPTNPWLRPGLTARERVEAILQAEGPMVRGEFSAALVAAMEVHAAERARKACEDTADRLRDGGAGGGW